MLIVLENTKIKNLFIYKFVCIYWILKTGGPWTYIKVQTSKKTKSVIELPKNIFKINPAGHCVLWSLSALQIFWSRGPAMNIVFRLHQTEDVLTDVGGLTEKSTLGWLWSLIGGKYCVQVQWELYSKRVSKEWTHTEWTRSVVFNKVFCLKWE